MKVTIPNREYRIPKVNIFLYFLIYYDFKNIKQIF